MINRLYRGAVAVAVAALVMATGAAAADTIKVGVIGPMSGPFALQGKNFKAGVDAYFAINGKKVGANEVEVIYRDLPAADPAKAKAIGQELIVKDKVQYLAGVYFTPDALAITPLLEPGNVPLVIFNAATSAITQKSPFVVRTSFTLWQTTAPMAKVAAERGVKKVIIAVSDYGPGVDAETAFKKTFEAAGGTVVEAIRMPLRTTDFSPIMQRVRDSGADALFAFLPAGPTTLGFVKAYNENGLKEKNIQFLAPGDLTQESDLPAIGDAAIGVLTTFHYSVAHKSPANEAFVAAATKALDSPDELSFPAVGAFDGMHVIAKMIEATGGKQDAAKAVAAVKGMAWESPRGPVKIDPDSRTVNQTIYLRAVEKSGGKLINNEIKTYPDVPDLGLTNSN
jgi:branched-chain amino acid transport system substrate-binding protein